MQQPTAPSGLPLPTPQDIAYARQAIAELKAINRGVQRASTARLWVHQPGNAPACEYLGHSSPDVLVCAEQACINQLQGIIPPVQPGQYAAMYLYHVNGQGPCGRCEGQLQQMANLGNHPVRVWWGLTNQHNQRLSLNYSDFVGQERYDQVV